MGIDIYAEWPGMTAKDHADQITGFSVVHGHVGYLREAYHGEPYATRYLVAEAFATGSAEIDAAAMAERLPAVLEIAEQREREIYAVTDPADIAAVLQSYRDFVALCATKQRETGRPCRIVASY